MTAWEPDDFPKGAKVVLAVALAVCVALLAAGALSQVIR